MKVIQCKVWVSIFVCQCGRKKKIYHYGEKNKPNYTSYPSCGWFDGWDLINEKCPSCINTK